MPAELSRVRPAEARRRLMGASWLYESRAASPAAARMGLSFSYFHPARVITGRCGHRPALSHEGVRVRAEVSLTVTLATPWAFLYSGTVPESNFEDDRSAFFPTFDLELPFRALRVKRSKKPCETAWRLGPCSWSWSASAGPNRRGAWVVGLGQRLRLWPTAPTPRPRCRRLSC